MRLLVTMAAAIVVDVRGYVAAVAAAYPSAWPVRVLGGWASMVNRFGAKRILDFRLCTLALSALLEVSCVAARCRRFSLVDGALTAPHRVRCCWKRRSLRPCWCRTSCSR